MTALEDDRFGYLPARPLPAAEGIALRAEGPEVGESWWSRRFIELLESLGLGSRLERGRGYASSGQVLELDVEPGIVLARVQGSRPTPYRVRIHPQAFSEHQWRRAEKVIAARALTLAQLLAGEMPHDIEAVLADAKLALLPASYGELRATCTCPDAANPCKHTAAVYYVLAERLDQDPFALFTMRGRTQEELLEGLRARRSKAAQQAGSARGGSTRSGTSGGNSVSALPAGSAEVQAPPLSATLDRFWRSGAELANLSVSPLAGEAPDALLRQLGPAGVGVGDRELVEILSAAYTHLAARAERRALMD